MFEIMFWNNFPFNFFLNVLLSITKINSKQNNQKRNVVLSFFRFWLSSNEKGFQNHEILEDMEVLSSLQLCSRSFPKHQGALQARIYLESLILILILLGDNLFAKQMQKRKSSIVLTGLYIWCGGVIFVNWPILRGYNNNTNQGSKTGALHGILSTFLEISVCFYRINLAVHAEFSAYSWWNFYQLLTPQILLNRPILVSCD